jgi:zinc protease
MLARNWERGFEILADCILHPAFPDDELEKERRQVLDEIHAQEDNLTSVAFRLFAETLWKKHPYRFDVLGTPASVGSFTRHGLADYYAKHFPASEMTLAVVGDVDPQRVIEKTRSLFGDRPRVDKHHLSVPSEDLFARTGGPTEVYKYLSRQQAHMVIGFPGTTIDDPDRYSLEVLATVLSGQGGRLFVELRDKKGLAYRVNAFSLEGIDPGYFAVYIACSPEKLGTALEGIREELRKICEEPVSFAELDRSKKYLVGTHEISLQRRAALSSTLAFHEAYGLGWDEYRRYSAGVLAVDAAAVQRIARKYLDWSKSVIATVKPEEMAKLPKPTPKRAMPVRKTLPARTAKKK